MKVFRMWDGMPSWPGAFSTSGFEKAARTSSELNKERS
jgi:hypothetical protein